MLLKKETLPSPPRVLFDRRPTAVEVYTSRRVNSLRGIREEGDLLAGNPSSWSQTFFELSTERCVSGGSCDMACVPSLVDMDEDEMVIQLCGEDRDTGIGMTSSPASVSRVGGGISRTRKRWQLFVHPVPTTSDNAVRKTLN